jgi:hypothetical protein
MGTGMTVIWSSYPAQRKYVDGRRTTDGRHRGVRRSLCAVMPNARVKTIL